MPKQVKHGRALVIAALEACHDNRSAAARQLGVAPATLRRWLDKDPSITAEVADRDDPSRLRAAKIAEGRVFSEKRKAELEAYNANYYRPARPRRLTDEEFARLLGVIRRAGVRI